MTFPGFPSPYEPCYYMYIIRLIDTPSNWVLMVLVVQPPVNISATQIGPDTAMVTWQPVESVLRYKVSVQDVDDLASPPSAYDISDTEQEVQDIQPCSTYRISVSSYSKFLVPSEPTDYIYTTNSESARPQPISITWWFWSRSAILSLGRCFQSMPNMILRVKKRDSDDPDNALVVEFVT